MMQTYNRETAEERHQEDGYLKKPTLHSYGKTERDFSCYTKAGKLRKAMEEPVTQFSTEANLGRVLLVARFKGGTPNDPHLSKQWASAHFHAQINIYQFGREHRLRTNLVAGLSSGTQV